MIHLERELKQAFYALQDNYVKMNLEEKALFIRNWSDNNMAHRRRNLLEAFVYMEFPKYFSKMLKNNLEEIKEKNFSEEDSGELNSIILELDNITSKFFKDSIEIRSKLKFLDKNINAISVAFKEKGEFNNLIPQVIHSIEDFFTPMKNSDRIVQRDIIPLCERIKKLLIKYEIEDFNELNHVINLISEGDWEEVVKESRHYSWSDLDIIGFHVDL